MCKHLKLAVYKDLHGGGYRLIPGTTFSDLPEPNEATAMEFATNGCDLERCNTHGGNGPNLVATYYYTMESLLVEK